MAGSFNGSWVFFSAYSLRFLGWGSPLMVSPVAGTFVSAVLAYT